LNSSASLLTISLLPPVIACHHWISVCANAGVATAMAAAAANRRIERIMNTPPGSSSAEFGRRWFYRRRMTVL
jgi:hypothetical protein